MERPSFRSTLFAKFLLLLLSLPLSTLLLSALGFLLLSPLRLLPPILELKRHAELLLSSHAGCFELALLALLLLSLSSLLSLLLFSQVFLFLLPSS